MGMQISLRLSILGAPKGRILEICGDSAFNFSIDHHAVFQDDVFGTPSLVHAGWWFNSRLSHQMGACPFLETPPCLHLLRP